MNEMSELNEFENITMYFDDNDGRNTRYEQFKSERKDVKSLAKMFKKGLKDDRHPINIVITMVEEKLSLLIKEKTNMLIEENKKGIDSTQEKETELDEEIKEIIQHIQIFVIEMQTALKLFYIDSVDLQCFLEEKDEIINLVCSQLFRTNNFYENVKNLFSAQLEKKVKFFNNKLLGLKGISQKEIGIRARFALTEETIELQKQIADDYVKNFQLKHRGSQTKKTLVNSKFGLTNELKEMNASFNAPTYTKSLKVEEKNNVSIEDAELPEQLKNSNNLEAIKLLKESLAKSHTTNKIFIGYNPAVKMLNGIKNIKLPYKKMIKISMVSDEITKCVNYFWEETKPYLDNDYLNINADDLMVLFIFILINSQMGDILVEEKIIDNFTTKMSRGSNIGYYYTTLQAAIDYVYNETNMTNDKLRRSSFLEKMSQSYEADEEQVVFEFK